MGQILRTRALSQTFLSQVKRHYLQTPGKHDMRRRKKKISCVPPEGRDLVSDPGNALDPTSERPSLSPSVCPLYVGVNCDTVEPQAL